MADDLIRRLRASATNTWLEQIKASHEAATALERHASPPAQPNPSVTYQVGVSTVQADDAQTPPLATHAAEKLRALALKATPGPWEWWTSNSWRRLSAKRVDGTARDGGVLCPTTHPIDRHPDLIMSREDQEYIEAANPKAILALLDRVQSAESELVLWRESSADPREQQRRLRNKDQA